MNPYYATGHVILNIGLVRADNKQPLNPTFVEQYLLHIGLDVRDFKLFQSNSEPMAVAVIRVLGNPLWNTGLYRIAEFLKQEAIAIYSPDGQRGSLVGPAACRWGPFNPQSFLMPGGKRLSEHS